MKHALFFSVSASVLALSTPLAPALAQEGVSNTGVDTITVTAQRRTQDIQDVPLAIEVVTAENIDAIAATNLSDLDQFVPGLNVGGGSPTQPRFAIRGVSTSDFGVGTDPAVGVYVDGIYAARSGASLLAFNDVSRVEVIKGPQGTLFGRNSAAGAISITSNAPSEDVEAELALRMGENNLRRFEGLVNIPFAEDFALRMNMVVNKRDGLLTDAVTGEDYDRQDNWAVRAAVGWTPGEMTDVVFRFTREQLDEDGRAAIGITPLPAAPGRPPVPVDVTALLNPFDTPITNDVRGNIEQRDLDEASLHVTHDFGAFTLQSISAFRYFETSNRQDEDGTNRIELYFDTNNIEQNQSWYQEFRLSGANDRFDWVAGVSYYDENATQISETGAFTNSIETALFNLGGGTPFSDLENGLLIPFGLQQRLLGHEWTESMYNRGDFSAFAAFADVEWRLTDRFSLIGGARYTRDEKTFSWLNGPRMAPDLDQALAELDALGVLGLAGVSPADFGFDIVFDLSGVAGLACDNGVTVAEGVLCERSDSWDDISPRLVANFNAMDNLLLFASYTQGYKAGGYNSVEVGSRFENEDVDNFEAGLKWTAPDRSMRIAASIFHYLYKDKQAVRLVANVGGSGVPQYVVETSDETGTGVDFQIDWAPLAGFEAYLNLQYIDVTFDERITRSGLDLSGQPTGTPEWSLSTGASQTWALPNGSEFEVLGAYAYTSENRCNEEARQQLGCAVIAGIQNGEAQHRLDLRAYWRDSADRFQLGAYVNNVFDEQYLDGVGSLTADTFGTTHAQITPPRMWGVDLRIRY